MTRYLAVVFGVALASPAEAGNPAWCKKVSSGFTADGVKRVHAPDVEEAVKAILAESCHAENDSYGDHQPEKHAEVDKARAALSQQLGMTEADWADAVAWDENNHNLEATISAKSLALLTPIDQYLAIAGSFKSDDGYAMNDPLYTADALEGRLTETGRLALLQWCVKQTPSTHEADKLLSWAVCQGDVDKLDVKKLIGELKADTVHPGGARFYLRIAALKMQQQLAEDAATKKKLLAKDPSYGKPYEVATAARADWAKTIGTNTKLLALVEQVDGGVWFHSRKGLEGCEAATRAALGEAVSTLPAKAFANMYDDREAPDKGFARKATPILTSTPQVHLAATAFLECQPKHQLSHYLANIVDPIAGARGPRMAALTVFRLTDFKFDDTKANPRMPPMGGRPWNIVLGNFSYGGVVKSAKVAGDKVKLTMEKTKKTQVDCVKEHWGNRVISVDSNGKFIYELICDKEAPVVHDTTVPDFEIPGEYASVVKPGVVISVFSQSGDVIAVWPNKTAKLPSWVLFGAVK